MKPTASIRPYKIANGATPTMAGEPWLLLASLGEWMKLNRGFTPHKPHQSMTRLLQKCDPDLFEENKSLLY